MKKEQNSKVSEDTPKLGLETGDQNVTASAGENPETKAKAEQEAKDKAEQEAKAGEEGNEKVWIRVILPLAGKFLMPHDPGAEFEIDKNQGEVIVEAAYAEYLTAEEIALK